MTHASLVVWISVDTGIHDALEQARPHELAATLAWFTPVAPGRRSYRAVKLSLLEPEEITNLRLTVAQRQPDANQVKRGTLLSRRWSGSDAPVVTDGMWASLIVQRDPDQGDPTDDVVPLAIAVTLAMPTMLDLYDQVRTRLAVGQPVRTANRE